MTTKRTQEEITERVQERREQDFLGFEVPLYMDYLTLDNFYDLAIELDILVEAYKDRNTFDEGFGSSLPSSVTPREAIANYMPFAWEKANDCRGISANRSIAHFVAWLWLDGEDELSDWANDDSNYEYYGKPILERICDHYGIDYSEMDDGERVN